MGQTAEGVVVVLKDIRPTTVKTQEGDSATMRITGRSLLGPRERHNMKFKFTEELKDKIEEYFAGVAQRQEKLGETPFDVDKMTALYAQRKLPHDKNRVTLNLQELKFMFVDAFDGQGRSVIKNGFGLRVPIKLEDVNNKRISSGQSKENRPKIMELNPNEHFETSFQGVKPTRLVIDFLNKEDKTAEVPKTVDQVEEAPPTPQEDLKKDDGGIQGIPSVLRKRIGKGLKLNKDKIITPSDLGQELTPEEVNALVRWYNPQSFWKLAWSWLKRRIGRTELEEDLYRILDEAEMAKLAGEEVWGLFQKGIIYLTKSSNLQGSYSKAIAHEQFHRVTQGMLKAHEREILYQEAVKRFPNLQGQPLHVIEEFLADRFMEYAIKRENDRFKLSTTLKRFFHRILRALNLTKRSFNTIDQFFDRVFMGYYGSKLNNDPTEMGS
jgi:hypothetical protein